MPEFLLSSLAASLLVHLQTARLSVEKARPQLLAHELYDVALLSRMPKECSQRGKADPGKLLA